MSNLTFVKHKGDGINTTFAVSIEGEDIGYFRAEDIVVSVDGEHVLSMINPSSPHLVVLAEAPADQAEVLVRRTMDKTKTYGDFRRGNNYGPRQVSSAFTQQLYLTQELIDGFWPAGSYFKQDMSMGNHRMTEVADGVEEGDAVNMKQYDFLYSRVARFTETPEFLQLEADLAKFDVDYGDFKKYYRGAGPDFPDEAELDADPVQNGLLFYYDGIEHTNGLYIHYDSYDIPNTGHWLMVSGIGPAGPRGAEGVEGPLGPQGNQGEAGPRGEQGVRGIQGVTGEQGPLGNTGPQGDAGPRGVQGVEGPTGSQGDLGPQGPQGIDGPQGVDGVQGLRGDSFDIDQSGTLVERDNHDTELENFVYYATDYIAVEGIDPKFNVFVGDGTSIDWVLDWEPSGPQSLFLTIGGVPQSPRVYEININPTTSVYTLRISPAVPVGVDIILREIEVSSGYGAIYIKRSDAAGDWSDPIPFGRGPQGEVGPDGIQGQQGPQGEAGIQGEKGPQGEAGIQGAQGDTGDTGAAGPQGPQGDRGIAGVQGNEGARGPTGEQGIRGAEGVRGPQGAQGDLGPRGIQGEVGPQGPTGNKGPEGDRGDQGIRGSRNFYLSVPFNDLEWKTSRISEALGLDGAVSDEDIVMNDSITMYNTGEGFSETRVYNGPLEDGIISAEYAVQLPYWLQTDVSRNGALEVVNGISGGVPLKYLVVKQDSIASSNLTSTAWNSTTPYGSCVRICTLVPEGLASSLPTPPDGRSDITPIRNVGYSRVITLSGLSIRSNNGFKVNSQPHSAGGMLEVLLNVFTTGTRTLVGQTRFKADLRSYYDSSAKSYTFHIVLPDLSVQLPTNSYLVAEIRPDNYLSGQLNRAVNDYWWIDGVNDIQEISTGYIKNHFVVDESIYFQF